MSHYVNDDGVASHHSPPIELATNSDFMNPDAEEYDAFGNEEAIRRNDAENKPKKRRNKNRRKSTYVEKDDTQYLKLRNRKILVRFLTFTVLFISVACTAVALGLGYDFSTVFVHDVAANWSLPAVGSVEFRDPAVGCGYPADYPGFDYFGYESRSVKGTDYHFYYKVWKGQLICLYPLKNQTTDEYYTASNRVAPTQGNQCPTSHPKFCGESGCFDSTICPVTRIEFQTLPVATQIDPATQFCHDGSGQKLCFELKISRLPSAFPLVELTSNAQQNARPLMCSGDYARKPHDGSTGCVTASSTFVRIDSAFESNELTLLAENDYLLPTVNDVVFTRARPAIYFRNQIRFDYGSCDQGTIPNFIEASKDVDNKASDAETLAIVALAVVILLFVYLIAVVSFGGDHRSKSGILGFGISTIISSILFLATAVIVFVYCAMAHSIQRVISPIVSSDCIIGEAKDNLKSALNNASARFGLALVAGLFVLIALGIYLYSSTLEEAKKNLPEGEVEEVPEPVLHPFEIPQDD